MNPPKKIIKIAHSPDADDAFMFYALKHDKVTSPQFEFEIIRRDIEELNRAALDLVYDITALSIHAYAHLADKYILTTSGASMAEKDYGPMIISRHNTDAAALKDLTIAVPGEWTTAFLILKIIEPRCKHVVIPFHQIMDAVLTGQVDAGLIIHEGQLQYAKLGLHKVLCLIDAWRGLSHNLPLPLGGNAINKTLAPATIAELSRLQKESILYAMNHPGEARDYAMGFKRDLTTEEADRYLGWYANERTVDMGSQGKEAIELLFALAFERGLLKKKIKVETI